MLWNKTCALDPLNVASLLLTPPVTNFIKRALKKKYKSKFSEDEIQASINRIILEPIPLENIKQTKIRKERRRIKKDDSANPLVVTSESQQTSLIE